MVTSWRGFLFVLALAPAAYLGWKARAVPHLGAYHDDSVYLVSAKALAAGKGYRIESLPEEPFQTKYPPLYPGFLALAWRLEPSFPANLSLALALNWMCLPVFGVLGWKLFERWGFGPNESAAMACLLVLNPQTQLAATRLMSDLLAAALLAGAFLALSRSRAPLGGVLTAVAFLARSSALPLAAAGAVWLWLRKERKAALAYLAPSAVVFLAWTLWAKAHHVPDHSAVMNYYTTYVAQFFDTMTPAGALEHLWNNLELLFSALANLLLLGAGYNLASSAARHVLVMAMFAGIWRLSRRFSFQPAAWFCWASLILAVVWNFEPSARMLFVLMPIVLAGFWHESARVLSALVTAARTPRAGQRIAAAAVFVLLAGLLWTIPEQARLLYAVGGGSYLELQERRRAQLRPVFGWVREHTPPGARFFAVLDPVFYLETQRKALRAMPLEAMFDSDDRQRYAPTTRLRNVALQHGLDYALLTSEDLEVASIVARPEVPGFELEYQDGHAAVWRITKSMASRF